MNELVARVLIAVHRWLSNHPRIHGLLIRSFNRSIGEKPTNTAILKMTRDGDVAWDVGANLGYYTKALLDLVGPSGSVVAIEPVPEHANRLRELGHEDRLTVVEAALGDSDGYVPIVVSGEDGTTTSIGHGPDAVTVRVARGDSLVAEGVPRPDVLKVDVESFEGTALDGLAGVLPSARGLVVEVHFAALARRGLLEQLPEPVRIMRLLRDHGFAVRWLDPSHLTATRRP